MKTKEYLIKTFIPIAKEEAKGLNDVIECLESIEYYVSNPLDAEVIVKLADINKIIYEMIDEVRKGYYDISDTIDLAHKVLRFYTLYDKGYIKALENLKSKISA